MHRKPLVAYTIGSDHSLCLRVLPVVHRLTNGIFGRGFGFALRRLNPFFQGKLAFASFSDQSRFYFEISDNYWNKLILTDFDYEPELAVFLSLARDIDYVFIDAGANLGYWSVLASSELFGKKHTIAIEASADTFRLLQHNCEQNHNRFSVQRNAIFNESGRNLSFSTGAHAGRHIDNRDINNGENVRSITLDRVIADHNIPNTTRVVIKLDVEGAEVAAIQGCKELMEREFLIIYEDHGKDKKHKITDYILNCLCGSVFYIDPKGSDRSCIRKVTSLSEMTLIKKGHPTAGCNFVFCKGGSFFDSILTEAEAAQINVRNI